MSRRRFMARCGSIGMGAAMLGAGLSSCANPNLPEVPVATVRDQSRTRKLVRFANWYDYIDISAQGVHPTLAEFTRQTGIRVDYAELFPDADQVTGLIGGRLAVGIDPGYDLIVIADQPLAQFIERGWAADLSPGLLTEGWRLLPRFRDWPVPDLRRYSLPWQGGFTGIGYNLALTRRPVTTMTELLTAPDLHGRVSLVTSMPDVMGLIMLEQGSDPGAFSAAEFRGALAMLRRSVAAGQVRVVSDAYWLSMADGKVAAGVAWSGDMLRLRQTIPALRFGLPDRGGMLWTDNLMIPALAAYRGNAERLMDFYYQPDAAAQLSAYTQYISPVAGAQAAMRRIDPALATEQYVFPAPALLQRSHTFKILPRAQLASYTTDFQNAVGL
jgi:spermidine/putrescine transport system substrate-binding protein